MKLTGTERAYERALHGNDQRQPIAILSHGISRHNFSPRASQAVTNAHAAARVCMEEMRLEAVCPEWSVAQCCRRSV